jgi:hypothetical protein
MLRTVLGIGVVLGMAGLARGQEAVALPRTLPTGAVAFDDYFVNKALRLDIYEVGDAKEETITLDNIYEEPVWSESPLNLLPPFQACHYAVEVYDKASGKLIFQHAFDGLFGEYKTTTPAINGEKRVFPRCVRIPEPKKPVEVVIKARDKKLELQPVWKLDVDPTDYHIVRETTNRGDWTFEHVKSGDPHDKVDLAFLAEGYTAEDKEKFRADVAKFSDALFTYEPYKSNRDKFNIYGVFRASAERGMDEPRQGRYKSTALGASYNTFDTDRYLTVQDDMAIFRMAAPVPHDTVVVLVNTNRYGGGGITMDVCISSTDNATSPRIFVHEFGHSFAALADEYTGDVAYNDMYPEGIEPLEINISRMLDKDHLKWKPFLTPGVALPTPAPPRAGRGRQGVADTAPARGEASSAYTADGKAIVGAFEGAGYMVKGMYRPQFNCIMGSALPPPRDEFCIVCKAGIQRMIDYYAPPSK